MNSNQEIKDVSLLKPHDVIYVESGKGNGYAMVKSCQKVEVSIEDMRTSIKDKAESIITMGCYEIKLIEFDKEDGRWSMTLPKEKIDGKFQSIKDSDFVFKFYTASMKDVETALFKERIKKMDELFQEYTNKVKVANDEFDNRINKSLQKLLPEN
jgi:hypothetical protein